MLNRSNLSNIQENDDRPGMIMPSRVGTPNLNQRGRSHKNKNANKS